MSAFIYLITRFFSRIRMFLKHWYFDSYKKTFHLLVNFLEYLDKFFAIEINFRHIFEPLYRDRSVMGYVIGFLFRTIRIILALIIYLAVVFVAIFLYLIWLAIPPFAIYKIIQTYYGTL